MPPAISWGPQSFAILLLDFFALLVLLGLLVLLVVFLAVVSLGHR